LRFGARGATTIVATIAAFAIASPAGASVRSRHSRSSSGSSCCFVLCAGVAERPAAAAIMAERDDAMTKRLMLEEQLRHSQKMEGGRPPRRRHRARLQQPADAIIGYTEIVLTSLDPKTTRAGAGEIGRAAMRPPT
jgi:hypothetical protein